MPATCRLRPAERGQGFALIAVAWLLALLTLLASSVAVLSVTHRRAAEGLAQTIRLDGICDSVMRVALLRLMAPKSKAQRVVIGAPTVVTVPAGSAGVTIERDAGKIDLNTADDELLYALFISNGWTDERAHAMVSRIADWKDPDDDPRRDGAERAQYAAAGLSYVPRNGPFESVSELRQVLGAEEISATLLSAFTVYTHASRPVESAASEPVMRALQLADGQRLAGHGWLSSPLPAGTGTPGAARDPTVDVGSLTGEVVGLHVCAQFGRMERCRTAVVRLTGNIHKPLQTFVWQAQFSSR